MIHENSVLQDKSGIEIIDELYFFQEFFTLTGSIMSCQIRLRIIRLFNLT